MAVSPFPATSALRVFRHVAQIPIGNQVLCSKTREFEKKGRVCKKSTYLSLLEEILQFSLLLFAYQFSRIPRSHFGHFCPFCHDWKIPLAFCTSHLIPFSSPNQGTNGHRIYVSRMSKYPYSAENKVNFVLWTRKTKTRCVIENVFQTGQQRDDLFFFFPVFRVKSTNSIHERLIRATHLHIPAITRAVLLFFKCFTKPVTLH